MVDYIYRGTASTIHVGDLFVVNNATKEWTEENGLWMVLEILIDLPEQAPIAPIVVVATNGKRKERFFPDVEDLKVVSNF